MKLIDLLVQELPKRGGWPCSTNDALALKSLLHEHRIEFTATPGYQWFSDAYFQLVNKEQYEVALAASKQVEWDGKSMPPIGMTCEHCPGGTTQTDWEIVTVLGISERPGGVFTDYWLRKEDGSSYIIGNPYRFRPIRTEAERRRDESAKSLCNHLDDLTDWDSPVGKAHALAIYDAIAAGKIPGVKLAD